MELVFFSILVAKYFGLCSVRLSSPHPKGGLEIKKQFLCFSSKKFIGSQEIKSFKMHVKRMSSKSGGGSSKWYTLWVVGKKKHKLDSKTPSRESVVWLSKTLSDWFEVPVETTR